MCDFNRMLGVSLAKSVAMLGSYLDLFDTSNAIPIVC
jgi:hypothetical protein